MHIDYEISEQDHLLAQRLARKGLPFSDRWPSIFMPWFGLVILVILIFNIVQQGFSTKFLPGFVVPLLGLSMPIVVRRAIHKLYVNSPNLHGPRSLNVDEAGMHFQGASFSSQINWSHFSRCFEDQNSFVLFQSPRIFSIVPKRQLSPEQITLLRDYFARYSRPM
jgi:hypothetical protein